MKLTHMAAAILLLGAQFAAHAAGDPYPAALPPEDVVRAALQASPEVRAARARQDVDRAEADRLRGGPNEWVLKTTVQRRTDADALRYRETAVALERPLRWFGKSSKDAELAGQREAVGVLRTADTWHESGRAFMRAWFDALRDQRAALLLEAQENTQSAQVEVARKRHKAGDAPRMDVLLAEAERDKAAAARYQAAQRAARSWQMLVERYPDTRLALPESLPAPVAPEPGKDAWIERVLAENHETGLAEAQAGYARLASQRAALDRRADPTIGMHYMQERDRQERVVGLTISIPLGGSARNAQAAASAAEAGVAAEVAAEVRGRVRREAGQAVMQAQAAHASWQMMASLAERQRAAAALVARAYALGEADMSATLLAQRQAQEAAANAENAAIDALQAHAALMLDAHAIWDFDGH